VTDCPANPPKPHETGSTSGDATSVARSSWTAELRALIAILLQGWLLVGRLPRVVAEVWRAFVPGGGGLTDRDFWAFGPMDAGFRPAYRQIANAFRQCGRFGYTWHEGLGMPLGMRMYNNLVTYRLLDWLGTRRMQAIGYLLMLGAAAALAAAHLHPALAILVTVLLAGSPFLISSYTHQGKPESFWWGVGLLAVATGLSGHLLTAALLWTLIAFSSLATSVMLALFAGPILLLHAVRGDAWLVLLLGVAPGILKHTWRAVAMWRAGFLTRFAGEQARVWKRPWLPQLDETLRAAPFILAVTIAAASTGRSLEAALLLVPVLAFYWSNSRLICINDPSSFSLAFWILGFAFAATAGSTPAVLLMLAYAYSHPGLFAFPPYVFFRYAEPNVLQRWRTAFQPRVEQYPGLEPTALPQPPELVTLLSRIRDGERCLFESDGDLRTQSRFRGLLVWTDEFLPSRHIEIANGVYAMFLERELTERHLLPFRGDQMPADEMDRICETLGVACVIAFRPETIAALRDHGYEDCGSVTLTDLPDFRAIVGTPRQTITLLRRPTPTGVVEPHAACTWEGNTLSWYAATPGTYLVKHRWAAGFQATIERMAAAGSSDSTENTTFDPLNLEPYQPFPDVPTTFIRLDVATPGRVLLTYSPSMW
jgi:hypothetical protein